MTLLSNAASAQESPPRQAGAADTLLSDVVVTATRQTDTVSRVPLAITAVTQKALDQQGVQTVPDLVRVVPSLQVSNQGATNQFTIRGISSISGAAVTGVYLDDTPLTKRNQNGTNNNANNGSPAPPLFDLERVEVLRGPQGTLYGGSSEGGTIRFITPTPSTSRYSVYGRAQISHTDYGDFSYEAGAAVGGPIIPDKLGFRASIFGRKTGGYVDMVNPYTGKVYDKDSNSGDTEVFRGVLLWRPTEQASIQLSAYATHDYSNNASTITLPEPLTNVQIAQSGVVPAALVARGWGMATPICIAYRPPSASVSVTQSRNSSQTPVSCTSSGITHVYPAQVLGPWNLDKYQQLGASPADHTPFRTQLQTISLTAGYDLPWVSIKSITSYTHDKEKKLSTDQSVINRIVGNFFALLPDYPDWNIMGNTRPTTSRQGITEEIRLSSPGDARPISWVAGLYYSHVRSRGWYYNIDNVDLVNFYLLGVTTEQRYGAPLVQGIYAFRDQHLVDSEVAGFGELNYFITSKLKLTGGLRVSRVGFDYDQTFGGPINGSNDPAQVPGGVTVGSVKETPVTPKFGAQYQISDNDQVYVSAAKGYRAGGVNSPLSPGQCNQGLAAYGLSVDVIPKSYDSDSIWSYELGTKVRLGGRVQVNAAVYDIEWTNLQTTVSVPTGCSQTWVQNVGSARSQGVELEAQALLFRGFTANLSFGYNKSFYTADVVGPTPTGGGSPPLFFAKDQTLGNQPYRVTIGAQYNFNLQDSLGAYIRGDMTYTPHYSVSEFGVANYSPDSSFRNATTLVNMRAGVTYGAWDVNLFVNNLFNSADGTPVGGRSSCSTASGPACTDFSLYNPVFMLDTFRPREIGLQAAYRF